MQTYPTTFWVKLRDRFPVAYVRCDFSKFRPEIVMCLLEVPWFRMRSASHQHAVLWRKAIHEVRGK
jgi:hypothetical protein